MLYKNGPWETHTFENHESMWWGREPSVKQGERPQGNCPYLVSDIELPEAEGLLSLKLFCIGYFVMIAPQNKFNNLYTESQ